MRQTILTAALVALVGGSTFANEDNSIEVETAEPDRSVETCKNLQNPVERLACYDTVSGFTPTEQETTGSKGWVLMEDADAFSGKDTSYAYIESDKADMRMSDAPRIIVVRCDGSGGHEIYVVSNGYIGSLNDRIPVRYIFDDGEPIRERWSESTDGTAAFLPNSYRDFRAGLQSGSKFVFEITDYRGTTQFATFEGLDGNREALDFVLNGCAG